MNREFRRGFASNQSARGRCRGLCFTGGVSSFVLLAVGLCAGITVGRAEQAFAAQRAAAPEAGRIGDNALQQIRALAAEKESRTPAQQKIDSQLLYALRMQRGQQVARGIQTQAVDVGLDDQGKVVVDITALVDDSLLGDITSLGGEILSSFPAYNSIRARVDLDRLEAIAGYSRVRFIQPRQEAMTHRSMVQAGSGSIEAIGSRSSQGDVTHRAALARSLYGVGGGGLKIGVLSDGVSSLAASQSLGDLGPVAVLSGQAGSGDEGTAMLEIVHDLAPDAELVFARAGGGIANFAQNIRNLRSAGCHIIVDDVYCFVESPFQDGQAPGVVSTSNGGVVTQAVNDATAAGALFFSSAGNGGNKNDGTSGTYEGDFTSGGSLGLLPGGTVHDFGGGVLYDTLTSSNSAAFLFWADPLGASSNDYDLYVLDSTGTSIVASSTNVQSGSQDPVELISSAAITTNARIVVFKKNSASNRYFHLNTNRGRLQVSTSGETHGHSSAANAFSVAATPAAGPYPGPFSGASTVETFSSDGPRRLFFNPDSTAITPGNFTSTGGLLRQKPNITAADGVSVTGVGGFPSPFLGNLRRLASCCGYRHPPAAGQSLTDSGSSPHRPQRHRYRCRNAGRGSGLRQRHHHGGCGAEFHWSCHAAGVSRACHGGGLGSARQRQWVS